MRITTVNHYIRPFGYELVQNKKEEYFYFRPIDGISPEFYDSMVLVPRLNCMVLSEWIRELVHKLIRSYK